MDTNTSKITLENGIWLASFYFAKEELKIKKVFSYKVILKKKKKKHRTFYTKHLGPGYFSGQHKSFRKKTFMMLCLLFYISHSGINSVMD